MTKAHGRPGTRLLSEAMARKKMTQTQLAEALSEELGEPVGQSYVWNLLQGAEPGIRRAIALKRVLRIPLDAWLEPRP